MVLLRYKGCTLFRQRIVASLLSHNSLVITDIRGQGSGSISGSDEKFGLLDFEANFLKLIEKLTDGSAIEINETGTVLRFKPGLLIGGRISHDCSFNRCIGWYIEGILPLAMFCKFPLDIKFTGITNDAFDLSVDILTSVTFPLLVNFGIVGAKLSIKRRGSPPKGGGKIMK